MCQKIFCFIYFPFFSDFLKQWRDTMKHRRNILPKICVSPVKTTGPISSIQKGHELTETRKKITDLILHERLSEIEKKLEADEQTEAMILVEKTLVEARSEKARTDEMIYESREVISSQKKSINHLNLVIVSQVGIIRILKRRLAEAGNADDLLERLGYESSQ